MANTRQMQLATEPATPGWPRGYRVLRFWNNDVLRDTDAVLAEILRALEGGE